MKPKMKKIVSVAVGALASLSFANGLLAIDGAGASFPAASYRAWMAEYAKATGQRVNYQAIGSGAGLAQIRAKTVDFGASDEPLMPEVLDKDGLMQFPMLMGGVVAIVNLPGIGPGEIKLSRDVLAGIFLGEIKRWTDSRITAINKGLSLPDEEITVVHRADGSGTTWIFTNYLSKISKTWNDGPRYGTEVAWPTGVGGQTNAGVAQMVRRIRYSIGYVESAFAFEGGLAYTQLENAAGKFVRPAPETFVAAASHADWDNAPGFHMILTDQPGDNTWPIMGATYILIHKEQPNADLAKRMLSFFDWAYKHGDPIAERFRSVPIPDNVVGKVRDAWKKLITSDGKPVWQ